MSKEATAAASRRQVDRDEQIQQLRNQIAEVSGRCGRGHPGGKNLLPQAETVPIPKWLAEAVPSARELPRGTVAVVTGARSLSLSMVAAVTAAGNNAVIVGQPDVGLLAAAEMGADLSRLAVIADPGADPVEVAAVLMDGMDLVVLGLGGRAVPPTRTRVMAARARHQDCTLLVTDGDWQEAGLRLDARVCGYETTGGLAAPGFGRISALRLGVRTRGRAVVGARAG